jgi:ABC-type nitrate/sulfonate/bicarbonate transport system permease component
MNMSLLESLWITFIEIILPLFLSTTIGTFLGWTCTKNYRTTKIFKVVFRLFVYSVATLPTIFFAIISIYHKIPVFAISIFLCCLAFITLYAIIGFEQARQNQNQWYLAIPNISLGMRIGLLLSWPALSIEILLTRKGMGVFLWDTYNSGNIGSFNLAIFSIITLAFVLDQLVDLSSLFLSKSLNSKHKIRRNS